MKRTLLQYTLMALAAPMLLAGAAMAEIKKDDTSGGPRPGLCGAGLLCKEVCYFDKRTKREICVDRPIATTNGNQPAKR